MHDDELEIDAGLARALIGTQFPEYARLELRRLRSPGTVNVIFRLGPHLSARFPRRAGDTRATPAALRREADRAAEFAGRSTVAAPRPVGIGMPGHGYPLAWSIQTWVPGTPASPDTAADAAEFARDLATLLASLRATPVRGRRFRGAGRGGDLRSHDVWVETCLHESHDLFDITHLRRLWHHLRDTPRDGPGQMTHGDLIPSNLLVADRRLVGVLDTGGFGPADPAVDLVVAWHLLGSEARDVLRAALDCDDAEWDRGKGWAFEQAIGAAWYYQRTNPVMHEMGMTTLTRLLESES